MHQGKVRGNFISVLFISALAAHPFASFAEETNQSETQVEESNSNEVNRGPASVSRSSGRKSEYSFRWLDPDKRVYVLQNRKFTKANRLMVSAMFGRGLTGTYRSSFNLDPRVTFYLNESWGFEFFYSKFFNSDSATYTNLIAASPSTLPNVREITDHFGFTLHWAPWYSKINVFNSILYFDWFFALGLGRINLQVDTRTASTDPSTFVTFNPIGVYIGTGHIFHVSRSFLARIDILGTIYKAEAVSKGEETVWVSHFSFNFGVGLKL